MGLLLARGRCASVLIASVLFAGILSQGGAQVASAEERGVLVERLLDDVRDTLIRIRNGSSNQLQLDSAKLEINTVFQKRTDGTFDLWVVSLGGTAANTATQKLVIDLAPPYSGDSLSASSTSDALAEAVIETYRRVSLAKNQDPPLRLEKLTASTSFVVQLEGGGGARFSILPVTIGIKASAKSEQIHSIQLVFRELK